VVVVSARERNKDQHDEKDSDTDTEHAHHADDELHQAPVPPRARQTGTRRNRLRLCCGACGGIDPGPPPP
jgi:hypothetical protein